jgi:ribose transport system substrate-binding protein
MLRDNLLVLGALAGLTLSGCGAQTTYKYRIAVIPKGLTHEFWQSIHRGADRAAADLKEQGVPVEILWDGPRKESDAQEQIILIDQKTNMGIHGLVLAPQDSKQMVPPVERAVAKKLSVVIIDSGLDKDTLDKNPNLIVKYVATDNYNGGKIAAQKLIEALQAKKKDKDAVLKVVLFRYAPGSESTERREQGFLDYVKEFNNKKELVQIVSEDKYAGATEETAEREAAPLLAQFPGESIDGIFAVNESAAAGMLNALRTKKRHKEITLVGFDSSEKLLQAVREGDVAGLVVQDPYRMGYLGVWTLVQHLEGHDVSANGKNQSTGEYFLTKENMESEEMRGRFDPEVQARRTIELPKHSKK